MSAPTTTAGSTAPAADVPAKPPVAAPAASVAAIALALLLVAAGVVAVRDALLAANLIAGQAWVAAALTHVDGLTAQPWMTPVGIGVAVLGLLLLFAAVKPRRRTHRALVEPDTWITAKDSIRLARCAAEAVTGVTAATATGSARRIALAVTPVPGSDIATLTGTVDTAVADALAPLARKPRVRIRINEQDRA